MKKIFFILLLTYWKFNSQAQIFTEVDSLKYALSELKPDTNKVITLKNLSIAYQYTYPDSAMRYAEEGLQLAIKLNYQKGEAGLLNEIGNIFYLYANHPKALENYLRSLKIKENLNDANGIAVTSSNIGQLYYDQGDYVTALTYFTNAKKIDEQQNSAYGIMLDDLYIGGTYHLSGKIDSALIFLKQSYSIAMQIDDEEYIGTILTSLGDVYATMHETDSALFYYEQSIPYAQAISDFPNLSDNYIGISKIFKSMSSIDSGIYYANKAISLAYETYTKNILDASQLLVDFYTINKNTDSTLKYLNLSVVIKDSLYNQEKIKQFQTLSFNEQVRQTEIAHEKIEAEKQRRKNIQLVGIAVFIITFFVFVLLLSKRKVHHKTIEFLGLVALLLLFEFIAMFVYPWIDDITNHTPVFILLCSVVAASILVPMHKNLERWIKTKIAKK